MGAVNSTSRLALRPAPILQGLFHPSKPTSTQRSIRRAPNVSDLYPLVMNFGLRGRGGKRRAGSESTSEFQNITEAQTALSEDIPARQRKYFISMMIRTLCFLLAVFTPSPYRWFFLVGAVTLPYISVIVANAGRETIRGEAKVITRRRELS